MATVDPKSPKIPLFPSNVPKGSTPKEADAKVSSRVLRLLGLQNGVSRTIYGAGKDKLVVQHDDESKAYWIPQLSVFNMRARNIENEVKTISQIRKGLEQAGVDPKASNLALDVERAEGKAEAWVTEKAESNLENRIVGKLDFQERVGYCRGVLNGLANLHKAKFIQGDVKLENVLVYKDGSVKVSDFGKGVKVKGDEENGVYHGNTRYGPPESSCSKKGDAYGAGICLIRILEEHVLHNETRLPTDQDRLGSKIPPANATRRGVEQFILECPLFMRSFEQKGTFMGKVLDFKARLQSIANRGTAKATGSETLALNTYIKTLCERLVKAGAVDGAQQKRLQTLLEKLTHPDPTLRLSVEQALTIFDSIFKK